MNAALQYLELLTRHIDEGAFSRSGVEFKPFLKHIIKRAVLREFINFSKPNATSYSWIAISTDLNLQDDWLVHEASEDNTDLLFSLATLAEPARTQVLRNSADVRRLPKSHDAVSHFSFTFDGPFFVRVSDSAKSVDRSCIVSGFACLVDRLSLFSSLSFYLLIGGQEAHSPSQIYNLSAAMQSAVNTVADRIVHGLAEYRPISNALLVADGQLQQVFLQFASAGGVVGIMNDAIVSRPAQIRPDDAQKPEGKGTFVASDSSPTTNADLETPVQLDLVFREALEHKFPDVKLSQMKIDMLYPDGVKTEDGSEWHAVAQLNSGGLFSGARRCVCYLVESPGEIRELLTTFRTTRQTLRDVKSLIIVARSTISASVSVECDQHKGELDVSIFNFS